MLQRSVRLEKVEACCIVPRSSMSATLENDRNSSLEARISSFYFHDNIAFNKQQLRGKL
jgi:hypothetical protein